MESAIFNNRKALLVTMHGKEKVIAPLLGNAFNIELEVSKNIDTDRFGSFSGEVERKVSPQLAAQQKIFAAWNDYDHEILIASEGSFFAHPSNPFLSVNNEYLILIDRKNKVAVDAQWNSFNINYFKDTFSNENDAMTYCLERGFPENGVILKCNTDSCDPLIIKDITSVNGLKASLSVLFNQSLKGEVEIESDMRAHRNPLRMQNIATTAKHLVNNMRNACPHCQSIGFSIKNSVAGLECSSCGFPSNETKGYIYNCKNCDHEEFKAIQGELKANPGNCQICNP